MKTALIIVLILLPITVFCQYDTSTATKQQTLQWIAEKLKQCSGSSYLPYSPYSLMKTIKIYMIGSTVYFSDTYEDESGYSETFDLNDMRNIEVNKNTIFFICKNNNCVEKVDNRSNQIEYNPEFILNFTFSDDMVDRLNRAFEHLLILNEINKSDRF